MAVASQSISRRAIKALFVCACSLTLYACRELPQATGTNERCFFYSMLESVCRQYINHIRRMENTYDQAVLWTLEEERVTLHYRVMDEMDKAGIEYDDRFHATELAYEIGGSYA